MQPWKFSRVPAELYPPAPEKQVGIPAKKNVAVLKSRGARSGEAARVTPIHT